MRFHGTVGEQRPATFLQRKHFVALREKGAQRRRRLRALLRPYHAVSGVALRQRYYRAKSGECAEHAPSHLLSQLYLRERVVSCCRCTRIAALGITDALSCVGVA